MQDLRGPRKIRPGLVMVWSHPSRSEAAYRSRSGHGRGAEIRPNLAGSAGGWWSSAWTGSRCAPWGCPRTRRPTTWPRSTWTRDRDTP